MTNTAPPATQAAATTATAAAADQRSITYRARQQSTSSANNNHHHHHHHHHHSGPRPILNWLSKKLLHPSRSGASTGTDAATSKPTFSRPSRDDAKERQAAKAAATAASSPTAAAIKQRRATFQGRSTSSEADVMRSTAHPSNLQGRNRNTLSLTPKSKQQQQVAASSAQGDTISSRSALPPGSSTYLDKRQVSHRAMNGPSSLATPTPFPILNRTTSPVSNIRHAAPPIAGPSSPALSTRRKPSNGSLGSTSSSRMVSSPSGNVVDLTSSNDVIHPLSRAFTFETRTSASPSLSSSSRFDLEEETTGEGAEGGYGSEDSFPRPNKERNGRRLRRMGSSGGASSGSVERASSFLDPLDPDGDARSWVPSVASASPPLTPVRGGRMQHVDPTGASEGIFLGNSSSGPPSRRPASFASMASASTSAAVRKMRRSSSLWDDDMAYRVRGAGGGAPVAAATADDDASLRPLPPSHASSIRLQPVLSAEDVHDQAAGSLSRSPSGKMVISSERGSIASRPSGPSRRDTSETLDPARGEVGGGGGGGSRYRSEEGLHADWRGAKTASLMVLRSSSRTSHRSARSGRSGRSSPSSRTSDEHDEDDAASKAWRSDDGLSRVSTKPTTVFSTESNNWIAGQGLHLPLAHIAQARDLDELHTDANAIDLNDHDVSGSTMADPTLRRSPRSPPPAGVRSIASSYRPPSIEYGSISGTSPIVPSPLAHVLTPDNEFTSIDRSAHLSQVPRHNAPHPRDNPRPNSPPNDNASVITLASSNCPPRNRGGTSIRTHATAPSVFGDSVGGMRDADVASVMAAPGVAKSFTTRSIAGSIQTWPEVREAGLAHDHLLSSGEEMYTPRSAATIGLGPPISGTSVRGFQDDNASLVALRGRRNSNGSLGSKFSYDIPPSQLPAAA